MGTQESFGDYGDIALDCQEFFFAPRRADKNARYQPWLFAEPESPLRAPKVPATRPVPGNGF